jgi:hypothetical protein
MATFHDDRGELHGITVVLETTGPRVYVGRCDVETDEAVHLVGVDVHEDGTNGRSNEDFIADAARFGHWERVPQVTVPRGEIRRLRRLGEIEVA